MSATTSFDVRVCPAGPHVAEITWSRPPNNFIDAELTRGIADALQSLESDSSCRAVVLAPEGKHFCGGANLASRDRTQDTDAASALYREAIRLFKTTKPIVAAVQGAAIGGGLGLALAADFRVISDDARLSANFSRLGYFPGFGLTFTLPRLIGVQQASLLLYTGRRVRAEEAVDIGLAEMMVSRNELRSSSLTLAIEIAESAPLSVTAIRARMRADLAASVASAIAFESAEQARLRVTQDFREGVQAAAQRRPPSFTGR
jgi:2-(1,2-epoxy-1,2-dihydrophenyl)acetyl-CoA isomerase